MKTLPIPEEEQLQALAEGLKDVYRLLREYLGDLNKVPNFGQHITVSKLNLINYLRHHPEKVQKHVILAADITKLHDIPALFFDNGKWIVCWTDHGTPVGITYFDDLPEAAANYLMAYW